MYWKDKIKYVFFAPINHEYFCAGTSYKENLFLTFDSLLVATSCAESLNTPGSQ